MQMKNCQIAIETSIISESVVCVSDSDGVICNYRNTCLQLWSDSPVFIQLSLTIFVMGSVDNLSYKLFTDICNNVS